MKLLWHIVIWKLARKAHKLIKRLRRARQMGLALDPDTVAKLWREEMVFPTTMVRPGRDEIYIGTAVMRLDYNPGRRAVRHWLETNLMRLQYAPEAITVVARELQHLLKQARRYERRMYQHWRVHRARVVENLLNALVV